MAKGGPFKLATGGPITSGGALASDFFTHITYSHVYPPMKKTEKSKTKSDGSSYEIHKGVAYVAEEGSAHFHPFEGEFFGDLHEPLTILLGEKPWDWTSVPAKVYDVYGKALAGYIWKKSNTKKTAVLIDKFSKIAAFKAAVPVKIGDYTVPPLTAHICPEYEHLKIKDFPNASS
jgi:hypothetical protein